MFVVFVLVVRPNGMEGGFFVVSGVIGHPTSNPFGHREKSKKPGNSGPHDQTEIGSHNRPNGISVSQGHRPGGRPDIPNLRCSCGRPSSFVMLCSCVNWFPFGRKMRVVNVFFVVFVNVCCFRFGCEAKRNGGWFFRCFRGYRSPHLHSVWPP